MAQPTPYSRQYNFSDFQTSSPSDPLPATQVEAELNKVKTNFDGLNTNIALIQRDDGKIKNQSVHKSAFDSDALALMGLSGFTVKGDWAATTSYAVGDLVDYNDATYLSTVSHTSVSAFATDLTADKWILLANAALAGSNSAVDKFEGDGSNQAFTLSYTYNSVNDIMVFVNGALKNPTDEYTLSGTTLTISTPPSSPSVSGNENVIIYGGNILVQAAKTAAESASSNASGFATAASNSATAAATSATNAGTSETNAATSNTNAGTSATTASTQAGIATTKASEASTSATSASTSASTATTQATNASTSATNASTSETNAATSASTASTQATNAATSATTSQNYALKIDGAVESSNHSSKAWAIGGVGVTDTAGSGSAKSWSVESDQVDGTEYSSKTYAISGSTLNAGSSKNWALGGGDSFSTSTTVGNTGLYSAKYYAEQAQTASASASGSLTTFQAVWQGSGSSDPTGGTVSDGDLFYNTTSNELKVYNSGWQVAAVDASSLPTAGFVLGMSIALG